MLRVLTGVAVVLLLGFVLWSSGAGNLDSGSAGSAPIGTLPDIGELYDPVRAGEPLPPGFRQLTRRDGIRPIYDPVYVPAADVRWADDTLVVGVAIEGEARAYPVSVLNTREMVIDRIGGIPVLVTW